MRTILLALSILLCAQPLIAQNTEYVNINLVQPQVWQIPGLPEAGVDAGGDLNLSIPVLSVPGRGIAYDIAFSYNSNITIRQQASWLGLGWSFNPGSITREPNGGGAVFDAETEEVHYYGVDTYDLQLESQPDVYYITLPGRGTVQATQANIEFSSQSIPNFIKADFVVNEHRSWKIEGFKQSATETDTFASCEIDDGGSSSTECTYGTSPRPETYANDYYRFVVTTDDGMRYVFEAPTLAALKTGETLDGQPSFRQNYVNTWRLRAILGTQYRGQLIPADTDDGQWVRLDWSGVYFGKINNEGDFRETRFLRKIVTPTHELTLNVASRLQETFPDFINGIGANSEQYPYQRLESLELKRRGYSALISKVSLDHTANKFGPDPTGVKKRQSLDAIHFIGKDGNSVEYSYAMAYNCDVTYGIDDYAMDDDFGFVDPNADGEQLLNCGSIEYAWRLTQLTYPTGGTESYEYEFDVINTGIGVDLTPEYRVGILIQTGVMIQIQPNISIR